MAVTNLTNTTWVFKQGEFTDEISITNATYNINFICNSVNYSQIILADSYDWGTISYNTTEVYMYHYEDASQTGWYETYYRTIEITGGTDVTNANLISWLEANATQQDPPAPPPQLANRYGLNFELYAESDTDLETPLISIDFVNVSNIELTSGRTWATGDQDHGNMIGFNDPIQGSVTISTQVMTDALLHVVSGGMAGQGTNTIVFQRVAGQAPKAYIMTASTVWQDADGNVHSEDLLFHKAVPRVAYNVSYSGEGDPLSMDVVFDLMESSTGNVLTIEKGDSPVHPTPTPTGYTLTLTGDTRVTGYDDMGTYVKVNSAPTSASDYSAYVDYSNGNVILNTGITNPISSVTKAYVWGFECSLNNIEKDLTNHRTYNTALELTLTDNSTLELDGEQA